MPNQQHYDWPTILRTAAVDRHEKTYTRGQDFDCTPASFRQQAINAALRQGYRIQTSASDSRGTVTIKPTARQRHEWDTLLNGEGHELFCADLGVAPRIFQIQAHRAARKRGLAIMTRTRGGRFYIQARPRFEQIWKDVPPHDNFADPKMNPDRPEYAQEFRG